MAIPLLSTRPLTSASLLQIDTVVLGFVVSSDGSATFPQSRIFSHEIARIFSLNLRDELAFLTATGKAGEIFEIPVSSPKSTCQRLIFLGLGKETLTDFRAAGAALGRKMRGGSGSLLNAAVTSRKGIRAHAIAMLLGHYQWSMKSIAQPRSSANWYFSDALSSEIESAQTIATAVCLARKLIHTPANIKSTAWLAAQAKKLEKQKNLTVKIFAGKDLANFGGLRAVGGSSPKPGPRMVQITYAPPGSQRWPHIVMVGKGITFDTGGVSLKRPYDLMVGMKYDMSGAAALLAVMSALPQVGPQARVTSLLMIAENALSSTAQRPSDVITQYGGTTVEVINTDAEGRLVLADGLAYADAHLDPDYLLDIATLTGAASLGLGRQHGAMYTRNQGLAKKLVGLGESSGDRVWRMPLVDDYAPSLKSSVADLNHNASAENFSAGSVTAALFLEHFAGKRNWVHIDMAGPGRSDADSGEYSKGGTGFGVRLLLDWIAGFK